MTLDLSLSPETRALADALRLVPLGETVTFAALSAVVGRDVQRMARGALESARRIVAREDGAVFASVRGQGLRRLRAEEAPDLGRAARRRIARAAGTGQRRMTALAAASNGMPDEAMRRLSAEHAALGLLAELSRDRNVPVPDTPESPPPPAVAARRFLQAIGALPADPGPAG